MDTIWWINGQKEAKAAMDRYYEELQNAKTNYLKKNIFLLMKELYDHYACIRKLWDYIEDAWQYTKRFIKKALSYSDTHDYFYIMSFETDENKFYKIGSSGNPHSRLKQHEKNYNTTGTILYTYDTHEVPASSLEDQVRNYIIRKYGEKYYIFKDRFTCNIDIKDIADKIPRCMKSLKAAEIV